MHVPRPSGDEPCLCGAARPFADCCAADYDRTTAAWQRARHTTRRLRNCSSCATPTSHTHRSRICRGEGSAEASWLSVVP